MNWTAPRAFGRRLVEHLDRCGCVLMRKPPGLGGAQIGRGYERGQ